MLKKSIWEDLVRGVIGFSIVALLLLYFGDKELYYIILATIILIAVALAFILIKYKDKPLKNIFKAVSDQERLERLRALTSYQFEDFVAKLYKKLGYDTKQVGGGADGGVDVIAWKKGSKHHIQCKKYKNQKITLPMIREFRQAITDKNAENKAIFITTSVFTTDAEDYAQKRLIETVDGNKLLKLIKKTSLGKEIDEGEFEEENKGICPKCGGELVTRKGKYGKFLGCSNYPKCKYTKNIQG